MTKSNPKEENNKTELSEKINYFFGLSSTEFLSYLKKLLNKGNIESSSKLYFLGHILPSSTIIKMVHMLTLEEQALWGKVLENRSLLESIPRDMEKRIELECLQHMRSMREKIDMDILEILQDIGQEKLIDLIQTPFEERATLMLVLTTDELSQLLGQIDTEVIQDLLEEASQKTINHDAKIKLLEKLQQFRTLDQFINSPFKISLLSMLGYFDREKEHIIFQILKEQGDILFLMKLAKEYYPRELIISLPAHILREALSGIDIKIKAEFLLTTEGDERSFWINTMTDEGSRAREMMDLELSSYENSPDKMNLLAKKKTELEKQITNLIRNFLKQSHFDTNATIKDWAQN